MADRPPSERCFACGRRVKTMGFECKCAQTFCMAHRLPAEHGCQFDYRRAGQERLRAENPRIAPPKLEGRAG